MLARCQHTVDFSRALFPFLPCRCVCVWPWLKATQMSSATSKTAKFVSVATQHTLRCHTFERNWRMAQMNAEYENDVSPDIDSQYFVCFVFLLRKCKFPSILMTRQCWHFFCFVSLCFHSNSHDFFFTSCFNENIIRTVYLEAQYVASLQFRSTVIALAIKFGAKKNASICECFELKITWFCKCKHGKCAMAMMKVRLRRRRVFFRSTFARRIRFSLTIWIDVFLLLCWNFT